MKIGIDASRYNLSGGTGVEHYSVKIIQGIIDHFKHTKKHQLVLYSPRPLRLYKTKTIQHRIIPFPRLWTKIRLSFEMLFHKPNILFVPSHVLPHFAPKKVNYNYSRCSLHASQKRIFSFPVLVSEKNNKTCG